MKGTDMLGLRVEHQGGRPLNGPAWVHIDLTLSDKTIAHWAVAGDETEGFWEDSRQSRQQWAERYVAAKIRPALAELLASCQ